MTDVVTVAIISGAFGTLSVAITTIGAVISRKAQREAKAAKEKIEVVHEQAKDNWQISAKNYETLTKVVENTNGNVERLQEEWAKEAKRREEAAWHFAFEAGRRAEMEKKRRVTDLAHPPVNDDEPKE